MNPQERSEFWSRAVRAEGGCLQPEDFEKVLDGTAEVRHRSHLQQCPKCAAEFHLYQEFIECRLRPEENDAVNAVAAKLRSPVERPPAPEARRARWGFTIPGWAVGLATVVLVAGLAWQMRLWHEPALRVDESADSTIVRSGGLKILSPAGELKAPPVEVAWEPVPDAQRYRVRLLEVDGTEVWSIVTGAWRVDLPEPARAIFVPLKTLRIEVEAQDSQGRVLRSGSVRSVVKP